MDLIDETYKITSTFPDYEKLGLRGQLNRCSVSIASNISEGTGKRTDKHFIKFLEDSLGSAFEWETQLIVSKPQGYISEKSFEKFEKQVTILQKKYQISSTV